MSIATGLDCKGWGRRMGPRFCRRFSRSLFGLESPAIRRHVGGQADRGLSAASTKFQKSPDVLQLLAKAEAMGMKARHFHLPVISKSDYRTPSLEGFTIAGKGALYGPPSATPPTRARTTIRDTPWRWWRKSPPVGVYSVFAYAEEGETRFCAD